VVPVEQYGAGDKEGAADSLVRYAIGPDYRAWLDRLIPGAFQELVADAAGANHALQERDPHGVADAIAPFLARQPMLLPASASN
jgi:hypothetical protein